MAVNDIEPPSRTPAVPPAGNRPSHHLASVAHHFFSASPASSTVAAPGPPVIVVQAGSRETAAMVHDRLRSSLAEDRGRALFLAVLEDLPAIESFRAATAGYLPRGAVVVWGTDRAAAGSLRAVRDLGRWIRILEPASLEIVLLGPAASGPEEGVGPLRSRVDRIARGLPVRVSCCPENELATVLTEPGSGHGTGCSP